MGLALSAKEEHHPSEESTVDIEALDGVSPSEVTEAVENEPVPEIPMVPVRVRPQIRSKAQSWALLPESFRGITVAELWEFYTPQEVWLEQLRWRCDVCHRSCSCVDCEPLEPAMAELQEPELTDAAEAGNGQSGPSGQSQAAERRLAVAGHCAAVGKRWGAKLNTCEARGRLAARQLKDMPESHGACSHCGADPAPGRWEGRNLYEVVEHMVKPTCAELRVSYVELLRRGPQGEELIGVRPDTFVSHWWGEEFPKFVRTLTKFADVRSARLPWNVCRQSYRNPKTWAFWICAFANNQYAIEHALGDFSSDVSPRTAVMTSAFATALESVDDVIAVLDDRAIIYTRIWCCFELFSVARLMPERKGKELEIFIADESGVVSSGCGNVSMMNELIDKVKTSDADASNPADKDMIESAMLDDGTTFEDLDSTLQELAATGVEAAKHRRCMEICSLVVMADVGFTNALGTIMSLTDKAGFYKELFSRMAAVHPVTALATIRAENLACRLQNRGHRNVRVNHRLAVGCICFSVKLWILVIISNLAGYWAGILLSIYYLSMVALTCAGRSPLRRVLDPVFV